MTQEAEHARLEETPTGRAPWRHWGPYLAERAWGTVREDYSADGEPWGYFPHDHAPMRAYRWNEEGLGGICDDRQTLCFAFAFWNGVDPILKERIYGLTGNQGNHGEDAKEYWWYLDSTPTHSWMRWRYVYSQKAFPYSQLVETNAARDRSEPEFELTDTGIFDDGDYWEIEADYAKSGPEDICIALRVRNHGSAPATLHVLPTLWYRNTWSWDDDSPRPQLHVSGSAIATNDPELGGRHLVCTGDGEMLFCENESNAPALWGTAATTPFPKDGIADHVRTGAATVNPAHTGTRASFHRTLTVAAGDTVELRLRLAPNPEDLTTTWEQTMAARASEADDFYAAIIAPGVSDDERAVTRQAYAGMLWGKQFYHYDVERWLAGDPKQVAPPSERLSGRNARWSHLNNRDVISMPDKWEYPWYASWDLAFHCTVLAQVDPEFAKSQLVLLCREWFMHPNGQLPAYEWSFGDVNPPVHAWAALRVFEIDGSRDYDFLERVFQKLLLNFTWWVNRKDADGANVFEGGFLGLDNIGLFDRSKGVPLGGHLQQSDATAWMAVYCLNMLEVALELARNDDVYEDIATKFFEHFTMIALSMNGCGLWNDADGFYYDILALPDGSEISLPVRSMVGLIPLLAVAVLEPGTLERLPDFAERMEWYVDNKPHVADVVGDTASSGHSGSRLLSIVSPERLRRILQRMLDEDEFLSPFGVRSLSRAHREHPVEMNLGGETYRVDYEPAESTTGLFGGNSNWRGPVWMPLNSLLITQLERFHRHLGDDFTVECPTGSGVHLNLAEVGTELARRVSSLLLERDGRRPAFGSAAIFTDPAWRNHLLFHEYFNGDTGAGLGASHQTGWTGLIAEMIRRSH